MGATDSKLAFRKGVFRLFEEKNIPFNADDYWSLFWTLPESIDDVYSLIGASDIRRARDSSRENLETLIDKLLNHISAIIDAPNFPATPQSLPQLLNCIRVLSRIIPYIFEVPDSAEYEDKIFWVPRSVERPPEPINENNAAQEGSSQQKTQPHYDTLPPRGDVLMSLTLRCLFLAGFTLPATMTNEDGSRVNYVVWESGVGSSSPIASSRENDMNRIEVLRLLTVLLSRSMYVPPSQVLSKEDRWLHFIVTKTERKTILALLCSLLNTACKYNPLGWGVPYNHIVFTDTREQLVVLCLRTLLVILDYHSPRVASVMRQLDQQASASPNEIVSGVDFSAIQDPEKKALAERQMAQSGGSEDALGGDMDFDENTDNAFRHYLSKLHRAQDFQFLIDGIYRILSNPMQATNTYLPGSTKRVRCHVEMMMLFWKLLEINSRFRNYMMETERALDLMVVLIFYAMENKVNLAQVGLVRMCAFILQTLSSDRTFGVKLNRYFDGHSSLPASIRIPAFNGTYADFLITSIYMLIATSRGILSTLYPALILTITNVSPYLKSLSVTSSSKLVGLFGSMSAPGFILADEANHRLVGYLLEAIGNIIQYQYSDNINLVYALVRSQAKIEKLRDMTLESAVAELERIRQLKEEKMRRSLSSNSQQQQQQQQQQQTTENTDASETQGSTTDTTENLSDKAKGKQPESAQSTVTAASSNSDGEGTSNSQAQRSTPQRQQSSSSVGSSFSNVVARSVHGFQPTEEWFNAWHSVLPLQPVLALVDYLVPEVKALAAKEPLISDAQVLDLLRTITPVGILPAPQPIFIRKFRWGEALVIWFRSMLWGQAYVSSMTEYCPWNGTHIKLFQIKHQASSSSSSSSGQSEQQQPPQAPTSPQAPAAAPKATSQTTTTTVQ